MLETDPPLLDVPEEAPGSCCTNGVANKQTECNYDFLLLSPGVRSHIKQHCVNKDFNKATLMDCLSVSLPPLSVCLEFQHVVG